MKRFYIILVTAISLLIIQNVALAHGADRTQGEQLVGQVQAGEVACDTLAEEQFENMGDYYMEQMMGESHEQMDAMMEQMMDEEGLTQMHAAMGKRMSGCDTGAAMPSQMMSGMMGMMGGGGIMGGNGMMNVGNVGSAWRGMMSGVYPFGFVALWYVVGVLGAVALTLVIVKYLRELLK